MPHVLFGLVPVAGLLVLATTLYWRTRYRIGRPEDARAPASWATNGRRERRWWEGPGNPGGGGGGGGCGPGPGSCG